jgi:4-hydroxythreonine-4-phosphate dehydrogenase
MTHAPKPLALTMGEPAGISGELVLKAWTGDGKPVPPFVCIADPAWLRTEAHHLRTHHHVIEVQSCQEALARFCDGVPVLPLRLAEQPAYGVPSPSNAAMVIESIRKAVEMTIAGDAYAVVTCPIHKASLYAAGFAFPGHTEFLASLSHVTSPVMMLSIEGLRVVPVTVHVSLAEAVRTLSADSIVRMTSILNASLKRDFGIASPRIGVAALNPHAGESGTMGQEEQTIIAPAIQRLRGAGVDATGPFPADTLFHAASRQRFDAIVCMYHDQALIPLKTLDFHGGVNTTLGLPFVRTSPDHGTAFDIAGKGVADPASLLAALRLASRMSAGHSGLA